MDRPIVSVFLALSLDGFIAGPHGDLAWLDPYSTDSPVETGYDRLMSHADTLVMGRNTYEKLLSFDEWPYSGKRVVVLTHRPLSSHYGETAQAGLIHDVLKRLRGRRLSSRLPGRRAGSPSGIDGGGGRRTDAVVGAGHPRKGHCTVCRTPASIGLQG